MAATIVIIAAIWTLSPVDDVVPQKEMKIVKSGNTPPAGSAAPRRLSPVPQVAPVHPAQPLNDPLLEGLIGDDDNMSPNISHSGLHATLRNEGRDQDWARRAEGALLGNIARVPYLDRNVVPRVTCGATLCEVVVTLSSAVTNEQANQALDVLQSAKLLVDRGEESQLDPDYHSVAVGPTDRNKRGTVFVRYIPRLI